MRASRFRHFNALLLLLSATLLAVRAQDFTINWSTIDGGGGTSTGGVYSVTGTIGQPDAGPTMFGGPYTMQGGFWGVVAAVQSPGAPYLYIRAITNNTLAVSWPSPSTGWRLEQSSNMKSLTWTNVGGTPTDDGTYKILIVTPAAGNRFYRLTKP